ncbi:MAG TPA: hypothetical protein VGH51_07765 [Candidatus Angelobacter sp.]|jgi:hypothetical protein
MELTAPEKQDFFKGRFYNTIGLLLAVTVTVDVALAIARHWSTYDWLSKSLGVVLLLNLLVGALTIVRGLKKEKKTVPEMFVQIAYIWVLIATLLFNR